MGRIGPGRGGDRRRVVEAVYGGGDGSGRDGGRRAPGKDLVAGP
jgi:hypothetical protein